MRRTRRPPDVLPNEGARRLTAVQKRRRSDAAELIVAAAFVVLFYILG